MSVHEVLVFDEGVKLMFVKLWLKSGLSGSTIANYGKSLNVLTACRSGEHVLLRQDVYVSQAFGAQKKLLNRYVPIRQESDGKKKVYAEKCTCCLAV